MRIQTVHLIDFKRFHDLTLDLTGRSTKVVALVGPNGSGKSSVFDAFEEFSSQYKSRSGKVDGYYKKSAYNDSEVARGYQPNQNVTVTTDQNALDGKAFIYAVHIASRRDSVLTILELFRMSRQMEIDLSI